MKIIGAGMAGLLAANMLHRMKPVVLERQTSLPNNHSAVLRFGSEKVSDALGIPFKKVKLIKTYLPWRNKVADCLQYSMKCSGIARSDRSIISEAFAADRWIAPANLIERMAADVDIKFDFDFKTGQAVALSGQEPIISTIPMPALMKLLGYNDRPEFNYIDGVTLKATVPNCEAYVSIYVPDPVLKFNRISITGDQIIAEYAGKHELFAGFELAEINAILGVEAQFVEFKDQRYAKIQPIDEDVRKEFMHWATDKFGIFSLGRFATWRPGLQLDDLVQDIRRIEGWINKGRYEVRKAR
jgi:hypothetical protein